MKEIKQILSYTSGLRKHFFLIALLSTVSAVVGFATPILIKYLTDWIVSIATKTAEFSFTTLIMFIGGMLLANLAVILATDIGGWHGDIMAIKSRRQLSRHYYAHLMTLPQKYYDNEVSGKIINRLSRAIADITQFLQFFSNNLLQMLLTIAITVGILFWYNWILAVLILLLIPTNLWLTTRTSKSWQKFEKKKNLHFDIASGRFAEVVGQMRLIKSFGTQKSEQSFFDQRIKKMVNLTKKQSRQWHTMNALRQSLFGLIFAAIYGILFYEAATGSLSIGDMVLVIMLVGQMGFPLRNLSFFVDTYQKAVANSRDYVEAMNEEPEPNESNLSELKAESAMIEFRNVSFAYDDNDKILSDISFVVKPNQKVALVGESGGGKTTITNLLMNLYSPDQGEILIDDVDIATVTRHSLRRHIATVFQDPALFSGTIRENIAYADPEASDETIEKAARAANAYEFIDKLEKRFDTEIGERGIKLSGGQKQRIAIARAILKDAPILILDEATSSLDSKSEHLVQEALDRLMRNRTVLIIAHRLSTISSVDQIVTLHDGRVDEIGSPRKLAKTGGIYAELLQLQLGDQSKAAEALKQFDISA